MKRDTLGWLQHTPSSDPNFKSALEDATLEALNEALDFRAREGAKTAFHAIRAEIHRRYKDSGDTFEKIEGFDAYLADIRTAEIMGETLSAAPGGATKSGTPSQALEVTAPGKLPIDAKKEQRKESAQQTPGTGPLASPVGAVTLAKMDAMPAGRVTALKDMTLPELGEAFAGLSRVEDSCEKLSGVVATLKGLVLHEVKRKSKGGFTAWVKENFPRSHKTATKYMRLAESFLSTFEPRFKNGSADTAVQFLTGDLTASLAVLEEQKLDLKNPVVGSVIEWTQGKSAYQLLLELPDGRGGERTPDPDAPEKTEAQCIAELAETARTFLGEMLRHAHLKNKTWRLLEDTEAQALAGHLEETSTAIRAWLKVPKSRRAAVALEEF